MYTNFLSNIGIGLHSVIHTDMCCYSPCEQNWLPRRVMSAWRVAGIIHAQEGWNMHECGDDMMDIEKVWSAAIRHGFIPLSKA